VEEYIGDLKKHWRRLLLSAFLFFLRV